MFECERINLLEFYNATYYEPNGQNKYVYRGNLPRAELMYYVKGETVLTFAGKKFTMRAGDMIYLPMEVADADYTVEVKESFALYNFFFVPIEKLPKEAVKLHIKSAEVERIYERTYKDWFSRQDGYYLRAVQSFYRVLELARRQMRSYNLNERFLSLAPSEEYISLRYCDPDFDYGEAARLSGLSYSYFKKLFCDKYAVPPVKYVTELRMKRARELLSTNMFTVSEVSEMCGYDNIYYFSNVFKSHFGASPTKYFASLKS